jgi:alpha-1,3-fucosyltransferase 10
VATRPCILFYNRVFSRWPSPLWNSLTTACRFTCDRRRLPEADLVLFYVPSMGQTPYPEKRPHQRWAAWSRESVANYPQLADPEFMARFDLTVTYQRGATVWIPYFGPGLVRSLRTPPREKTEAAPAVYFQSSAVNGSGREEYVTALMQHLKVDSYGRVLRNRPLPGPDRGRRTKLATLARYRFTLAFENSIAEDYVTEKFFDPLRVGSVPVYLGAPNVADFAPGDRCFINAADFDGPRDLADHLRRLDGDDQAYAEHLAWKRQALRPAFLAAVRDLGHSDMDSLCRYLRKSLGLEPGGAAALAPLRRLLLHPDGEPLRADLHRMAWRLRRRLSR